MKIEVFYVDGCPNRQLAADLERIAIRAYGRPYAGIDVHSHEFARRVHVPCRGRDCLWKIKRREVAVADNVESPSSRYRDR